jgi:UDP-N-acetylglucosamine 2-epimerase (non-hydrolysing)
VHVVGDTAIDVLRRIAPAAESCRGWEAYDLPAHGYVLVDVVGDAHLAAGPLLDALQRLAEHAPVALRLHGDLPVAPATLAARGITGCAAVRHLDRLSLLAGAGAVITNLGTIQDEASALGVACFTIGDDTDRPFTVSAGTNVLLGADLAALASVRPTGQPPVRNVVAPWDGRAAERVAQTLVAHYVLAGERPSVAQS